MTTKRIMAVILALLAVFSLASCKSEKDESSSQEQTTAFNDNLNESVADNSLYTENATFNNDATVSEGYAQESSQSSSAEETPASTQAAVTTTESFDDPAAWSKERVVDEYKKAARKSNSTAKLKQSIVLKKITMNNGEYDKFFSLVTPIIGKFLESNSTEKDGITGGFENLVPQDVSLAKAYKQGNDTVIEIVLAEQISGPKEDALEGSVGHGIAAVGDISVVVNDLSERGLPLELSEEETIIYYTNPIIKVVVNDNGEIISGTWSYTVEIKMNNFKAFGKNIEKASIIMDNTLAI